MSKRYRRNRRGDEVAEGIAALAFLLLLAIQGFISRLSPEWKAFLTYSIPFTIFIALLFGGLFIWHRRRLSNARTLQERQVTQQGAQQAKKEQDLQFRRTSQISAIKNLDAIALEKYIAELFQRMGYKVSLTPAVGDHGIDVRLVNPRGEKEVAQCKQWPKRNKGLVGEPEVRDFYGAMMAENAVLGYMIAPHGFTQEAMRWATGKPIVLAHANWLYLKASEIDFEPDDAVIVESIQQSDILKKRDMPVCPRCGTQLIVKRARKGTHAGQLFYGCPNYPRCRAFILIEDLDQKR